jgi:hypothetical protein
MMVLLGIQIMALSDELNRLAEMRAATARLAPPHDPN